MLHAPSDLSRVTSSDILTEAGLSEEIICTLKKKKKNGCCVLITAGISLLFRNVQIRQRLNV